MNSQLRQTARTKIAAVEGFGERCSKAFYEDLFASLPGARSLFRNPKRAMQMFSLMVELLTSTIGDEDALDDQLDALGKQHRMLGIQPMHLRIGRQSFLHAVCQTCPELTDEETALFGAMFDRMTDAMVGGER